jgi:hypothetical protein
LKNELKILELKKELETNKETKTTATSKAKIASKGMLKWRSIEAYFDADNLSVRTYSRCLFASL